MPVYDRPGARFYTVATKAVQHGAPCTEENVSGTAIKQKAPGATAALSTHQTIAIGEAFAIKNKGIVEVPAVAGVIPGDTVWINATNNVLTEADPGVGNGRKYGRCVEVAGDRGTPTGRMRVDLDAKDSF